MAMHHAQARVAVDPLVDRDGPGRLAQEKPWPALRPCKGISQQADHVVAVQVGLADDDLRLRDITVGA